MALNNASADKDLLPGVLILSILGNRMLTFIPKLKLSEYFFIEVVRPILDSEAPGLRYTATLVGAGSEVLGFDAEMSSDHDWGARMQLFRNRENYTILQEMLSRILLEKLPKEFSWVCCRTGEALCVRLL